MTQNAPGTDLLDTLSRITKTGKKASWRVSPSAPIPYSLTLLYIPFVLNRALVGGGVGVIWSEQAAGIISFFSLKIWIKNGLDNIFHGILGISTKGAIHGPSIFEEILFFPPGPNPKTPEMVLVQNNNDNLKPQVKTSGEHWKVWTGSSFWEVCGGWEQSNPGYVI